MASFTIAKKACGIVCILAVGIGAVILFVFTMCGVVIEMTESALGRQMTFSDAHLIPNTETTVELPPMIIRGDLTRVLVRQEMERSLFVNAISESIFPLVGIDAEFTRDGFILGLRPIFAPMRLRDFQREHVLVFLPGEGVIEQCFPARIDRCIKSIVGREYESKRVYTEKGALAKGSPRLLVVIYGLQEYKT